jgi:hypothetical protein
VIGVPQRVEGTKRPENILEALTTSLKAAGTKVDFTLGNNRCTPVGGAALEWEDLRSRQQVSGVSSWEETPWQGRLWQVSLLNLTHGTYPNETDEIDEIKYGFHSTRLFETSCFTTAMTNGDGNGKGQKKRCGI